MNRLQALSALSGIGLTCLLISGLTAESNLVLSQQEADSLRATYSKPTGEWPRPWLDSGVVHRELGTLPKSPLSGNDSLKPMIELGKTLFFDPRLSGSGQISCATCHDPERSFTDNRSISLGHDQQAGTRNAPSLLNIWAMNRLFWDGRSNSLEEQSQSPIGNNMSSDVLKIAGHLLAGKIAAARKEDRKSVV